MRPSYPYTCFCFWESTILEGGIQFVLRVGYLGCVAMTVVYLVRQLTAWWCLSWHLGHDTVIPILSQISGLIEVLANPGSNEKAGEGGFVSTILCVVQKPGVTAQFRNTKRGSPFCSIHRFPWGPECQGKFNRLETKQSKRNILLLLFW